VSADPVRLRQILVNLVGNAIKFTKAGSVRLTLAPGVGDLVRFEVCDTGVGVPQDKLDLIGAEMTSGDPQPTWLPEMLDVLWETLARGPVRRGLDRPGRRA